MNSEINNRLDESLKSANPNQELLKLVEEFRNQGWSQLDIYDVFESYIFSLDDLGREAESEIITEVIERIYGWCSPHLKLFPKTLSNEEIARYREAKGVKNE
jgi:hypothetical protein